MNIMEPTIVKVPFEGDVLTITCKSMAEISRNGWLVDMIAGTVDGAGLVATQAPLRARIAFCHNVITDISDQAGETLGEDFTANRGPEEWLKDLPDQIKHEVASYIETVLHNKNEGRDTKGLTNEEKKA